MKNLLLICGLCTLAFFGCQTSETTEVETPAGDSVAIHINRGAETSAEIAGNLLLFMDGSQNFEQMESYTLSVGQLEEYFRQTELHQDEYGDIYYTTLHKSMQDTLKAQLLWAKRQIKWAEVKTGTVTDTVLFSDGRYFMQVRLPLRYLEQPYLLTTECVSLNNNIYFYKNVILTKVEVN